MNLFLENKIVFITGASSGIGAAAARMMHARALIELGKRVRKKGLR